MNTIIQTRVNVELKKNAEDIFSKLGLSLSDAIRMFLSQATLNRGMPFTPMLPNEPNRETKQAIADTEAGHGVKSYKNVDEMFKDLELDVNA